MSTHHTLVLSTQQSVTPATWNQHIADAGGTMNLAWTDFEPSEIIEESDDKRVLFFGPVEERCGLYHQTS